MLAISSENLLPEFRPGWRLHDSQNDRMKHRLHRLKSIPNQQDLKRAQNHHYDAFPECGNESRTSSCNRVLTIHRPASAHGIPSRTYCGQHARTELVPELMAQPGYMNKI